MIDIIRALDADNLQRLAKLVPQFMSLVRDDEELMEAFRTRIAAGHAAEMLDKNGLGDELDEFIMDNWSITTPAITQMALEDLMEQDHPGWSELAEAARKYAKEVEI